MLPTHPRLRSLLWMVLLGASAGGAPAPADEAPNAGEDAVSVCPGASTVKGIDTSSWQGSIDWNQVKQSGQAFAIARVSDGLSFPDKQFATDWPAIKAAGLVRGAYQFWRPAQDPIAQADLFLQKLQQYGALGAGDLPAILDVETVDGVATSVFRQRMQAWLDHVEQATGKKPMIYTAAFMASTIGTGFSSYPLWVANYGVSCPSMPAGFTQWVFWQDADNGKVPGISGGVDVDLFNGTLADLKAFASGQGNGGGGVNWSCASSAYQGQQLWTCSGGNLYECQNGAGVEKTCALGCVARPTGKDDLCIDPAPQWSCASSAYQGNQYWTCHGGALYRCSGATPETLACPAGCTQKPLGSNDVCN